MATLAVTNDFSAGAAIVASEMNTNFTDIETFVNTTPGVLQLTGGTVTGAVTLSNTLTVGADDIGYDVKFFGATATNGYMLWDESEDDLVFGSAVKVGIGSTTPVTALEIASDDDLTDFTSANRGMFTLSNTDHATDDIVAMDFRYTTGAEEPSARIGARMTGGGSELVFGTSNDYAGITNEALTIDPSGQVGIGGAPDQLLTVAGALGGYGVHIDSSTGAGIEIDRGASTNAHSVLFQTAGVDDWAITNYNDGDALVIKDGGYNGTEVARFQPAGDQVLTLTGGGFYSFDTQSMINRGGANGTVALAGGAAGMLLNSTAMNSTSWATPPLFFTSTDSAFTTESPKNLACLVGVATSTYNADSSSGMGLRMKLTANAAGTDDLLEGSDYGYSFGTTSLNAYTDNTASCGLSARLWTVIYAASGTIDTSDVRDKTDIADLDYGLDFVNSLRPVSYRYAFRNEEVEGVRTHMGFVAQEVEEVLGDEASNMGVWTTSEFEETGDWDENDEPIYSDADRQGLRYTEMVAPLVKAVQELTTRIAALEAA